LGLGCLEKASGSQSLAVAQQRYSLDGIQEWTRSTELDQPEMANWEGMAERLETAPSRI